MKRNILIEIIGWVAVVSLLSAYILITFEIVGHSLIYQTLNITGAAGLAVTAVNSKNWQSLVVQLLCIAVGISGVWMLLH
jgi:hypothetical protein